MPAVARSLFAVFLALWLSARVRSPPAARRTRSYHQASDLILTYVDDDFEELSKGFVPPNTVADTRKCVRLFQDWAKDRNAPFPGDKVSHSLLSDHHKLQHSQVSTLRGAPLPTAPSNCQSPMMRIFPTSTSRSFYSVLPSVV